MKFLYILCFLLVSDAGGSQDYFSRIIPTDDNPLIERLHKIENQYIISTDFFNSSGVRGGMIIVYEGGDEKVKFDNMDLSADPIFIKDDKLYFLGEKPFREGDSTFFISKVNNLSYEQEWYKEFSIKHPKMNPRTILISHDFIYIVTLEIKSFEANYPQETSVFKFDLEGNLQDILKYNTNKWASFAWNSFISLDSALILSSIISTPLPGPYSQVLKIDQEGEVIWEYEGTERLDNGAVPTWAIELSDESILQTYYVDRRGEVDFIINNWYPEPNMFIWLNESGELVNEKMILTDKSNFLYYDGLKSGRGDYFYAFGYYENRRPAFFDQFYGHLTKFSNEGDTIWSRNYQHPLYLEGNITHNIKDIIEEENGDITILADITPPAEKTEVWLFKVNSEGCYVNEECEDMATVTSIDDTLANHQIISPNPTTGNMNVAWNSVIKKITILDVTGKLIKSEEYNSNSIDLDISTLNKGIYILQIQDEMNTLTSKKIIKL